MKIYLYYLILIIIAVCFVKRIFSKEKSDFIISEVFWVLAPWCVCLSLYFFCGISYQYKLKGISLIYILLFWFMFFMGRYIGLKLKMTISEIDEKECVAKKSDLRPLYIVSIVFTVLYMMYILLKNEIVFGVTRNIKTSMLGTLFMFFSESALIIWLYELAYSLLNDVKLKLTAYFAVVLYSVPALLISGRDLIMILLISTLIVFVYCGKLGILKFNCKGNVIKKIKKVLIIGGIIVVCYFVFLTANRYGSDMISLFEWSTKSTFSEELMNIVKALKGIGFTVLNAIYYYSSQFTKFAWVYDNYNGPYIMGLYQLHFISRRFPESWGLSYVNCGNAARALMKEQGYEGLGNMWGTVIEYCIYDFGRLGTLIFAFFMGILVARVRKRFNKEKTIFSILYQAMICVAMFITVQFSPIFNMNWLFPFIWLIIFENFNKKKGKYNNEVRRNYSNL